MKSIAIYSRKKLKGTVILPGDKSISHRAAILASLCAGATKIKNFLFSDDCLVTLDVLSACGILVKRDKKNAVVSIVSRGGLCPPRKPLWMGESGTSCRVLLGLLAGQNFKSKIMGASSLMKRPMARVITPLALMGASLCARKKGKDQFLPITINPSPLSAITWQQSVSSAQVKSAILLAGLYARGQTKIIESDVSRDHTERMLKLFGAAIEVKGKITCIEKSMLKTPGDIFIPSDISSAAFFMVAALVLKEANILIKDVGINPTRSGIVRVLRRMGGAISFVNQKNLSEPYADIQVRSSMLKGTIVRAYEIPSLIDELPILMVAATLAKGKTVIEGAHELRVKETDRIRSVVYNLLKLGANIQVKSLKYTENIEIKGVASLKGAHLKSFSDHRTAMSMYVAALAAQGSSTLDDVACMNKSFPDFLKVFSHLFGK